MRCPPKFRSKKVAQYAGLPWRQLAQWPQWSKLRTTGSPGPTFSTPGPTRSTTPEPSWPSTAGRGTGYHWSRTIRSVWQTPTPTMRTSTSPARGSSTSTSSIEKGRSFSHTTAAMAFINHSLPLSPKQPRRPPPGLPYPRPNDPSFRGTSAPPNLTRRRLRRYPRTPGLVRGRPGHREDEDGAKQPDEGEGVEAPGGGEAAAEGRARSAE